MASDERTGRGAPTFKLAIGPKIQFIGARSTPTADTLVAAQVHTDGVVHRRRVVGTSPSQIAFAAIR